MKINSIYKSIINRTNLWNYYNKDIERPVLSDVNTCMTFIKKYILYSKKSKSLLFDSIDYLDEHYPSRLTHILSTFFLGLWLFRNNRSIVHNSITREIKQLSCFRFNSSDLDKQFTFVWFMATLFHDLGYKAEYSKEGKELPIDYSIPDCDKNGISYKQSIPSFYKKVYSSYYNYRLKKEHGIYAGLNFDKDICDIRRFQEHNDSKLSWREELEELYHYVAWIILAHNIWMIREDNTNGQKYKSNGLNEIILSSEKDDKGFYKDYKIKFCEFPLFTFFCIVDTIEPTKSTSCLSEVDIKLNKDTIIIESNDSLYRQKVLGLNDWLTPVTTNVNTLIIHLL